MGIIQQEENLYKYLIFEGDSTAIHDFLAFGAFGGKFLFKTADTINISVIRNDEWSTAHLGKKMKNFFYKS